MIGFGLLFMFQLMANNLLIGACFAIFAAKRLTMFGDLMGKLGEMQQRMEDMKKRLDTITVIGEAGSGLVKATVTGNRKLVNLQISPELIKDNDTEAIEDLVTVAVNRALEQAEKVAEAESTAMGKDMLPGFPGLGM